MAELRAVLELLYLLLADAGTTALLALLAMAAVTDHRHHKIPNVLTFGGIVLALICHLGLPAFPAPHWSWGLLGMLAGFGATLPLYALRAMGAGDVKLMAMVGAFLGPLATMQALLFTVVTAGIAAILFSLQRGALLTMLGNLGSIVKHGLLSVATALPAARPITMVSVGKLPYGVSIALGTTGFLVARQLNFI